MGLNDSPIINQVVSKVIFGIDSEVYAGNRLNNMNTKFFTIVFYGNVLVKNLLTHYV